MTIMIRAKEAVESLYNFRDNYFENNGLEKAGQKTSDVAEQLKNTLQILEESRVLEEQEDRAQFLFLKGRALNIVSDHDPCAEECLTKAVKLNPKLVEAWEELGFCLWKKGDIKAAKNCFEGALKHGQRKESMRSLSMVLRQQGTTYMEKMKFVQESVEIAREALNLDITDGVSWYILGNAQLNLFFYANQNEKILKQCMAAYSKALEDKVAKTHSDLHFNRATALRYEADYQAALQAYSAAISYDPSWTEPYKIREELLKFLETVQDMIQRKGFLKAKKLQSLLKGLKEHHLGPYGGGSYTTTTGQNVPLIMFSLKQLEQGPNRGALVHAKVVGHVPSVDSVPFTFCVVDKEETCMLVSVYNLAQGKGCIIGDSVAIPEPFFERHSVKYQDKEFQFCNLRVSSPVVLVVNGRKLTVEQHVPPTLSVTYTND